MQVVRDPLLSNQVNLSRALVAGLRVRWSFGRERSIRCPDASGESSRLGRQQPTSIGGWTTTAAMSSIRRRAKVQRYRYAFVCTSGDKKTRWCGSTVLRRRARASAERAVEWLQPPSGLARAGRSRAGTLPHCFLPCLNVVPSTTADTTPAAQPSTTFCSVQADGFGHRHAP